MLNKRFIQIISLSLLVLVLLFIFDKYTELEADVTQLTDLPKKIKVKISILTTIAQMTAGVTLLIGLFFTGRNTWITEDGKITDRFSKAIEQLGHEKVEIRLGGIYALERIAIDSERDHQQIMEVFTAFVRFNSKEKIESTYESIDTDVQAVITVIGRRKSAYIKGEKWSLDLSKAHLPKVLLKKNANFDNANFRLAFLEEADLTGASLNGTYFEMAKLNRANLTGASLLKKASLRGAFLNGARLDKTKLCGADLRDVHLESASITKANLEDANFAGAADLENADFFSSSLKRANFTRAYLREACLREVNLTKANLKEANLEKTNCIEANLTEANFSGAFLMETNFEKANFLKTNLKKAYLEGAVLTGAKNLTIEQLSTVETLYKAVGLNSVLLNQIKSDCPHLLKKPQSKSPPPNGQEPH